MISHKNIIANMLQYTAYESVGRGHKGVDTHVVLGLMPMSHIYGLVVVSHSAPFRGDEVIVMPRFEIETYLAAIERFKIEQLIVVSPHPPHRMRCAWLMKAFRFPRLLFACSRLESFARSTTSAVCGLYTQVLRH